MESFITDKRSMAVLIHLLGVVLWLRRNKILDSFQYSWLQPPFSIESLGRVLNGKKDYLWRNSLESRFPIKIKSCSNKSFLVFIDADVNFLMSLTCFKTVV